MYSSVKIKLTYHYMEIYHRVHKKTTELTTLVDDDTSEK